MRFMFRGESIRKSTGCSNKTAAETYMRNAYRAMEDEAAGISAPVAAPLFKDAADAFLDFKRDEIAENSLVSHAGSIAHLSKAFKDKRLSSITREDVKAYQRKRLEAGPKPKTVNIEVGTLRSIMIHFGQWDRLKKQVKMLKLNPDEEVGRALTAEEQTALLEACSLSRSRLLYFMAVLAVETGARDKTIKRLRWRDVDFADRSLRWGKDKTPAGSGRVVPLNQRAFAALQFWASQFPHRRPDHFVFPTERISNSGHKFGKTGSPSASVTHDLDPTKHIGSVKTAWRSAKVEAGWILAGRPEDRTNLAPLVCRFHDLRHTAASRMLKGGSPITTVAKILGWSASTMTAMAKRYSHYLVDDLREAMEQTGTEAPRDYAQNYAHPKSQLAVGGSKKRSPEDDLSPTFYGGNRTPQ